MERTFWDAALAATGSSTERGWLASFLSLLVIRNARSTWAPWAVVLTYGVGIAEEEDILGIISYGTFMARIIKRT